jgi:hypothetical protein
MTDVRWQGLSLADSKQTASETLIYCCLSRTGFKFCCNSENWKTAKKCYVPHIEARDLVLKRKGTTPWKRIGGVEVQSTHSWHKTEVSGQFHVPAVLPPGKDHRRLGRPQGRFERCNQEKKTPYCPCRESNPSSSLVLTLTKLLTSPLGQHITNIIEYSNSSVHNDRRSILPNR